MTYLPIQAAAPVAMSEPAGHPRGLARRFVAMIHRVIERERSRRELDAMPDELLKDIGINRCDIPGIIAGRRDPTRRQPLRIVR